MLVIFVAEHHFWCGRRRRCCKLPEGAGVPQAEAHATVRLEMLVRLAQLLVAVREGAVIAELAGPALLVELALLSLEVIVGDEGRPTVLFHC